MRDIEKFDFCLRIQRQRVYWVLRMVSGREKLSRASEISAGGRLALEFYEELRNCH